MNATPLPLRRRVALALTALGFLLSTLFAAATIAVTEDYEYVIANEILRGVELGAAFLVGDLSHRL